jgi:choice-of-anchor C domain-containing protein
MRSSWQAGLGIASLVILGLAAGRPASAQIVNGSFESPTHNQNWVTYGSGAVFGGWTVSSGSIDHIRYYWQAADGSYSVDLSGSSIGSIYQDVLTTPGQEYLLEFAMAGNPDGLPLEKEMEVFWGGSSLGTFSFLQTGHTKPAMGWENHAIQVVGGGSDRLEFKSLGSTYYGPALDDVRMSAIPAHNPEPGTLALLSAGGLGLFRAARRRKRVTEA